MPWQKPSPETTIDALARRLAEVERALRRGKTAPNVRHLGDTDTDRTAKAKDGQALVYNESTGTWRPGSSGGDGAGAIVVKTTATTVASGATSSFFWTSEIRDTNGFFTAGNDYLEIPSGMAGLYLIAARSQWATTSAAGSRRLSAYVTDVSAGINYHVGTSTHPPASGGEAAESVAGMWYLDVGDLVIVNVTNTDTVSVDVLGDPQPPRLGIARIGA